MTKKTTNKWTKIIAFITIIASLFLVAPVQQVHAESSTRTSEVKEVEGSVNYRNLGEVVAPNVSNDEIQGKIERGGSQIYGIIQTVTIYASYIGFGLGILWTIFGFGRNGRTGGLFLMLFSSIAFFFIGYGPETVGWLGEWFNNL